MADGGIRTVTTDENDGHYPPPFSVPSPFPFLKPILVNPTLPSLDVRRIFIFDTT